MRRFDQYVKALSVLSRASEQDLRNEFIQSGIIDKFSLQFELGLKMLKDLLRYEGDATAATGSPREILKAAYRYYDFIDEITWLAMMQDRNAVMHIYDEEAMLALLNRVLETYIPAFETLSESIASRYGEILQAVE